MDAGQIVAFIIIPLVIFLLTGAAGGIAALVKFTGYMARSQAAQEDTAKTNQTISDDLKRYMQRTDSTLINHTTELAVHRSLLDALQNGKRS